MPMQVIDCSGFAAHQNAPNPYVGRLRHANSIRCGPSVKPLSRR